MSKKNWLIEVWDFCFAFLIFKIIVNMVEIL